MTYRRNKKSGKEYLIFFVGLGLILLVVLVTFLKPALRDLDKKNPDKNDLTTKEKEIMAKYSISSADLDDKLNKRKYVAIIDLRDPDSFAQEHIIDSINLTPEEIDKNIDNVDKTKEVVIIDEEGNLKSASLIAAKFFQDKGYLDAHYLAGGFSGWKAENRETVSQGDPESFVDQSKVKYLSSDEVRKMIDNGANIQIIDVRKENAYKEGHIKGAINIYLEDLERKRKDISSGRKIILVDNDGIWAMKAAVRLFDLGFFNAYALSDGLDVWKAKGYELVN